MNKKFIRTGGIILGILLLIILLANFGLNIWLKYKLPGYIQKNSDYAVQYKTLRVDLLDGGVYATRLSVKSKNPENRDVMAVDGTVDTLSVARLGIIDAVFSKKISSDNLILRHPKLKIILANPTDKKGKKRSTPSFRNIEITRGDIAVWKTPARKFLSVNDLNVHVKNLEITEGSVSKNLPVVFDKYDISGRNFFLRTDNVYAFTAARISTDNSRMKLQNFAVIPLLSYAQFVKLFPQKRNLFDFKAPEVEFADIGLKDNKIVVSNVRFESPELKMYTTPKKKGAQKSFTYEVNLDGVLLHNAKIDILKPGGSRLFAARQLDMKISKFFMDEESAKGNIPFQYESFKIGGKDINYVSDTENILVKAVAVNQKSADLRYIFVKPEGTNPQKAHYDMRANRLQITVNEWDMKENKLHLDADKILVDGLSGSVISAKNPVQNKNTKPNFDGIRFPLKINDIRLNNSDISVVDKNNQPMALKGLNMHFQNIEMTEETAKSGSIFKTGSYSISGAHFGYDTRFYNISFNALSVAKGKLSLTNFAMKPKVSRAQFIRMIPTEKDLYDITARQISAVGSWDVVSGAKFVDLSQLSIDGANAVIFRSKIPKDDPTEKPLYSKLLRTIKFPLFIANTDLKNSTLVYEEDTKASEGPGKLTFGSFNMNVKNLNSGKMKGKPTAVPIVIRTNFMNASPMNVRWNFNTASLSDDFSIAGNISGLPAPRINPFIEPYLKIRATGAIDDLSFDFHGNNKGLNGTLKMKHKDLKISILNKEGEKNKLLSAVANIFVKKDSDPFPESVVVDDVKRDPTKSFFNMFWKGVQEGLGKTLIGKNFEANEVQETLKGTKTDVKDAVKGVKETVKTVGGAKKETPKEEPKPEKKNIFQKIFGKKK